MGKATITFKALDWNKHDRQLAHVKKLQSNIITEMVREIARNAKYRIEKENENGRN